jgi:hypothetical protein
VYRLYCIAVPTGLDPYMIDRKGGREREGEREREGGKISDGSGLLSWSAR